MFGDEEGRIEIGRHNTAPFLERKILKTARRDQTCIVDEDIASTKFSFDMTAELFHLIRKADIADNAGGSSRESFYLRDGIMGAVAIRHHNVSALGSEPNCKCLTDTLSRARDHRNFILMSQTHEDPP